MWGERPENDLPYSVKEWLSQVEQGTACYNLYGLGIARGNLNADRGFGRLTVTQDGLLNLEALIDHENAPALFIKDLGGCAGQLYSEESLYTVESSTGTWNVRAARLTPLVIDFPDPKNKKANRAGIRVAGRAAKKGGIVPLGQVRFKAVIKGIAAETSDVGKLVRRLEESEYFCSVSLSFSRNKQLRVDSDKEKKTKQVSEFEMSCYLANYRIADKGE